MKVSDAPSRAKRLVGKGGTSEEIWENKFIWGDNLLVMNC